MTNGALHRGSVSQTARQSNKHIWLRVNQKYAPWTTVGMQRRTCHDCSLALSELKRCFFSDVMNGRSALSGPMNERVMNIHKETAKLAMPHIFHEKVAARCSASSEMATYEAVVTGVYVSDMITKIVSTSTQIVRSIIS